MADGLSFNFSTTFEQPRAGGESSTFQSSIWSHWTGGDRKLRHIIPLSILYCSLAILTPRGFASAAVRLSAIAPRNMRRGKGDYKVHGQSQMVGQRYPHRR